MEKLSVLLPFCEGNPLVTVNELLKKQSGWFEMPWNSSYITVMKFVHGFIVGSFFVCVVI